MTENKSIMVVLVIGLGLAVFGLLHVTKVISYIRRRQRVLRKPSGDLKRRPFNPRDSLSGDRNGPTAQREPLARYTTAATQTTGDARYQPVLYESDKDRIGQMKRAAVSRQTVYSSEPPSDRPLTQPASEPKLQPGTIVDPPPKSPMPAKTSPNQTGNLEQMMREIMQLKVMLEQKAERGERVASTDAITTLQGKFAKTDQKVDQVVLKLESTVLGQVLMDRELAKMNNRVSEVALESAQIKQQLRDLLQEMARIETQLQSRFSEFQVALDRQTAPDSFYAKTLGVVLGQNVETLHEGNFERLMGDRLNQFFQTGVEHGEGLQKLCLCAKGISAALKDVSIQMDKLNPQASVEVRPPLQRVEELVNELSRLQAQLQNRRATVETTLKIPVSLYAGARQTFLDELGRGIKREINKLNDPESYFASELKHLITTDIIAVVDICDQKIAHPALQPQLESSLKQLFEQSGLRSIVPRQGEPFRIAEQDLIQMTASESGKRLTVAQVVTRGFYYKHRDNETLLRKAGVMVYR